MKKKLAALAQTRPSRSWVVILVVLVLVVAVMLTREIRGAINSGNLDRHMKLRNPFDRPPNDDKRTPLTSPDAIAPWMTFRYISFAFGMPETYFKDTMKVDHKNFPDISVGKYAKSSKIEVGAFVESVKSAVRIYLQTHPKSLTGSVLTGAVSTG